MLRSIDSSFLEDKHAKILLKNLAKKLLDTAIAAVQPAKADIESLANQLGVTVLTEPSNSEINKLAKALGSAINATFINKVNKKPAVQLALELVKIGTSAVDEYSFSLDAINKLKSTPAVALTGDAVNLATAGGIAEELNNLIKTAILIENISIGKTRALLDKSNYKYFISDSKYDYSSNRINSTSIMLPINNPSEVIYNVTYSINNGHILTEYKKRAYFQEDDDNIGLTKAADFKKSIYCFGTGSDHGVTLVSATSSHTDVQNALLKNVSLEICFDLANGVRHTNGWNNAEQNKQSSLLILQSNSIDPVGRTYNSSNINNLPRSSKEHNICVFHVNSSQKPPCGSHIFKINASGAPIMHKKEEIPTIAELQIASNGINITMYKVN
jgi:hypothetical protein